MTRTRAPSKSTCLVLSELSKQALYGYALMKATNLKSGTLYPILIRLTERGFLEANWEAPKDPGRPPRQRYQLTIKGRSYAKEALASQASKSSPKSLANDAVPSKLKGVTQ